MILHEYKIDVKLHPVFMDHFYKLLILITTYNFQITIVAIVHIL